MNIYSNETKAKVIADMITTDLSIEQLAQKHNIPKETVHRWNGYFVDNPHLWQAIEGMFLHAIGEMDE